MQARFTGFKMMLASLIAFVIIGRLIFKITGYILILLVVLAFLGFVFWAGSRALFSKGSGDR